MILIEKTSVMNFENAIRGARNPLNSWSKMDSSTNSDGSFVFGTQDMDLAKRLCRAGSDHRKFVRQIFVSVDLTAPIYWWKEFDTYKVATVANSTSTMHKIHSKPFCMDDFSCDHMTDSALKLMTNFVQELETIRQQYMSSNGGDSEKPRDKSLWYSLIQLLPSSYNQKRTVTMNYENLIGMYHSRKNHKLQEWHTFCEWIIKLPYFAEMFDLQSGEKNV